MNSVKVLNQSLANYHAKACIAARSTRLKLARTLSLKWRLLRVLPNVWDLRVSLWLASRRLQRQLLKQSREYYRSEQVVANLGEVPRRESWFERGSRLSRRCKDFLVDIACRDLLFHYCAQRKKFRLVAIKWRFM